MTRSPQVLALGVLCSALLVAGCASDATGSGKSSSKQSAKATGPIKIWYSNNPEEKAWGVAAVSAWNSAHADQKVTGQEIPAGKTSEEVIGAAITAGNAPCLVLNTAPAAVPQFQKQGGLVALDSFADGASYISARSGATADQYKSTDGKFYQMPWKSNPVVIFYNKTIFTKAGIDANKPPLATYAQFLGTAQKVVSSGAAKAAIYPAPTSEFFQSWFDFYPTYAAATGKQLVENGKSTFADADGLAVANFWRSLYAKNLAPNEKYNGDSFADGKAAMATVGPWAISVYKGKVNWGAVPVPTKDGSTGHKTFSDEKSIGMYSACKNRATAWEVLKFLTSKDEDGKLLTATGQMPVRSELAAAYPAYFAAHPQYKMFADQAGQIVEVPNVANSIQIWQTFRDAWSKSVIFGKQDVTSALTDAAKKIDALAAQK